MYIKDAPPAKVQDAYSPVRLSREPRSATLYTSKQPPHYAAKLVKSIQMLDFVEMRKQLPNKSALAEQLEAVL